LAIPLSDKLKVPTLLYFINLSASGIADAKNYCLMLNECGEASIIYMLLLLCKKVSAIKHVVIIVLKYFSKRLIIPKGSDEVKKVNDLLGEVYREILKFKKFKSVDDNQEFNEQFFCIKSSIVKKMQELQEFIPDVQKYMGKGKYAKFEKFYNNLNNRFMRLEEGLYAEEANDLESLFELRERCYAFANDLSDGKYKKKFNKCIRSLGNILVINDLLINYK